jgi:hypothetical protein
MVGRECATAMWKRVCTSDLDSGGSSLCVGAATFLAVWSAWTMLDSLVTALPTLLAAALVSVTFVLSCRTLVVSSINAPDAVDSADPKARAAQRRQTKRLPTMEDVETSDANGA